MNVMEYMKILGILVYNASFTPLAQIVHSLMDQDKPSVFVFYFFVIMMFVPEAAIVISKSFRNWIREGAEDADGGLNSEDLVRLQTQYAALWMLRIFVLFGLLMIFYDMKIEWSYYMLPFFGALGLEGVALYKGLSTPSFPKK